MSRTRRPLGALAAIAMVALMGAGCANAPGKASSGTADSGTANRGGDTTATTTARDKGVKFADCVRANGVSDFPDPDASGDFMYGVSVSPEVWKKAVDACKDLQPPGTLSANRNPEQQTTALKFAQCIRDHGVPDFPDPVQGEPLIDTNRIPSANRTGGMSILNAATEKCGDLLDAAAKGQ